jgi:hypothetical protein
VGEYIIFSNLIIMAKILLTLSQYHHIIEGNPWVVGEIKNIDNLLLILQDPGNSVSVTQDEVEVMKLEFDPQETNQIREVLTYPQSY